jgi:hypothetical protein
MVHRIPSGLAKRWWLKCISCSEASMTTQLRSVGEGHGAFEQASHALSGGFMHTGRACGLLTGAILAAGVQARVRFDDDDTAIAAAVFTAGRLAQAFPSLTGSVNCGEITGIDLRSLAGRLRYMRNGSGSRCGHFHMKWGSQANGLIEESLLQCDDRGLTRTCSNCAVATLRKLARAVGLVPRDSVMVAGLAGGVGLLGNVCGALAAGVFAFSATRYLDRPDAPRDSWLRGGLQELAGSSYKGELNRLRLAFTGEFGSDLCIDIVGRRFADGDDHSDYVADGGCREVVDFVAQRVEGSLSTGRALPLTM